MIRAIVFFFLITCFSSSFAEAKDVDCTCPTITCGPCQKKISVGKEVRFCSWGEINVCRKVICENVNYYFGCISSLKNGKKDKDGKQSLSDVKEDEDFTLPYEEQKKWSSKQKRKKAKRKVTRKLPPKKVSASKSDGIARKLPPKKVSTQERQPSSLRIAAPVKEVIAPTADEILRRNQKDEPVNLSPAGRIEAENESRRILGKEYSEVIVGKVTEVKGALQHVHHGEPTPLKKNADVYIGNEILNQEEKPKKITLLFPKGETKLVIGPKSRLIIHDPHSLVGRFQPFVHLVYGSLEADIQMDEGSFDILSGKVITRMTKGKMKTHYEIVEEELKVNVECLKGSLVVIKADDLASPGVSVEPGHFISWESESAFLSPVFAMSEDRQKKLGLITVKKPALGLQDWAKKDSGRTPASNNPDESLCRKPMGRFQQCAWSCEGNGKNAKDCEAQKSTVHCVRRICNAAGQWGQATPFASAYRDLCPAEGTRVGDCQP